MEFPVLDGRCWGAGAKNHAADWLTEEVCLITYNKQCNVATNQEFLNSCYAVHVAMFWLVSWPLVRTVRVLWGALKVGSGPQVLLRLQSSVIPAMMEVDNRL